MCQHDINKKNNSVILSKRRMMVAPSAVCGVCLNCGLSLRYIKQQDGSYVLKEVEDENL